MFYTQPLCLNVIFPYSRLLEIIPQFHQQKEPSVSNCSAHSNHPWPNVHACSLWKSHKYVGHEIWWALQKCFLTFHFEQGVAHIWINIFCGQADSYCPRSDVPKVGFVQCRLSFYSHLHHWFWWWAWITVFHTMICFLDPWLVTFHCSIFRRTLSCESCRAI